jgi:beta-xylosidase
MNFAEQLRDMVNNPSTISDLDMMKLDLQIAAYRGKYSMGIDAELFHDKTVREFIVHNGFKTYYENEFVLTLDWSCE